MKRLVITIVGLIIIGIIGGILFHQFWYKEYKSYQRATNYCVPERSGEIFKPFYLDIYPEGRYYNEVYDFWINCQFDIVKKYLSLDLIYRFKRTFPESRFEGQLQHWEDSLWQVARNQHRVFLEISSSKPHIQQYFDELFKYFEQNSKNQIFVRCSGEASIKKYFEYSEEIRSQIEQPLDRPVASNLLETSVYFTNPRLQNLNHIIDRGMKDVYAEVFGEGFVSVYSWKERPEDLNQKSWKYKNEEFPDEDDVVINLTYTIRTQEYKGVPVVWKYTEGNVFQNYVLGIEVEFRLDARIPGSSSQVTDVHTADAGEYFLTYGGIAKAYPEMIKKTFENYSQEVLPTIFSIRP